MEKRLDIPEKKMMFSNKMCLDIYLGHDRSIFSNAIWKRQINVVRENQGPDSIYLFRLGNLVMKIERPLHRLISVIG